jgi:DNA-directed RNA polymerase subunit RPC12/RpoP
MKGKKELTQARMSGLRCMECGTLIDGQATGQVRLCTECATKQRKVKATALTPGQLSLF